MREPSPSYSMISYARSLWEMRHYAWELGRSSVRAANAGTSLGALWLFLEPLFSIAIYWAVFGVLLDLSRSIPNFLAFLTVGQITFGLSQRAMLGASSSLAMQAPMLRSLAFPRAVLPLAAVLKALSAYRAEMLVMLVAVLVMGEQVRWSWIALPLIPLLQVASSLGIGLVLARMVWHLPDLQRLITHFMRLIFYASGVFYPLSAFTNSAVLLRLATLNPFYSQIQLSRWTVLGLTPEFPGTVIVSCVAWAVVSLLVGTAFFLRDEQRYSGSRTIRLSRR